ncbi:hypothetical protein [Rhodococcoides fascians]|uniref:hypothetical protein n=1 Tax=Rhodococcoides fascians TaxID=1828 RepID=UPI0011146FFD
MRYKQCRDKQAPRIPYWARIRTVEQVRYTAQSVQLRRTQLGLVHDCNNSAQL